MKDRGSITILLIVTIAWIATLGGAYWTGRVHEANAVAARQLDTVKEEIVEHNQQGAADASAAVKIETEIIYKRDRSREKRYELERDIARKEADAAKASCAARCDYDEQSLGLLRDAVRRANAEAAAAGKSRGAAAGAADAGRREGGVDPSVAGRSYRGLRGDPRPIPGAD
jgi:hypothetical protein